ncbi:hypothetical protein NDU88_003176 [Pleurodeles waltl]|uniref:Uncharacterized protein n=1 Tax=Pleurodeles waltl TaxID=8319 RepID=A0AAV7TPS5_PLEWA|nr:hypothetical protein NDU88_003176 [Pleurodeles waltl]
MHEGDTEEWVNFQEIYKRIPNLALPTRNVKKATETLQQAQELSQGSRPQCSNTHGISKKFIFQSEYLKKVVLGPLETTTPIVREELFCNS